MRLCYHLGRHPIDCLGLVCSRYPAEPGTAIFWSYPEVGLKLLPELKFRPLDRCHRSLTQWLSSTGGTLPWILADESEQNYPLGEWLDRASERHKDSEGTLHIPVDFERFLCDGFSLGEQDRLCCYWEAGDILSRADLDMMIDLAERVRSWGAQFSGMELYQRSLSRHQQRFEFLQKNWPWHLPISEEVS